MNISKQVMTDINQRWEEGRDHHPKANELAKIIADLDYKYGDDFFELKFGGDGDNGEHLTYLLDIYFDQLDIQ